MPVARWTDRIEVIGRVSASPGPGDLGDLGKVELPAKKVIRDHADPVDRLFRITIAGVSIRRRAGVIPETAETVEQGEGLLKDRAARDEDPRVF